MIHSIRDAFSETSWKRASALEANRILPRHPERLLLRFFYKFHFIYGTFGDIRTLRTDTLNDLTFHEKQTPTFYFPHN